MVSGVSKDNEGKKNMGRKRRKRMEGRDRRKVGMRWGGRGGRMLEKDLPILLTLDFRPPLDCRF